jgi:hypothetical protein
MTDLKDNLRQATEYLTSKGVEIPLMLRWDLLRLGVVKTYDFFLSTLERLVKSVYNNQLGGEFIDILANLIQGQLTQAYTLAWDEEGTGGKLPDYLQSALTEAIAQQYTFVDQFYRDIVDARLDGTPIDPLLSRCGLWANRYAEAYNQAIALITAEMGGNLIWQLGATEEHCPFCSQFNGIVARATEWDTLGIKPQHAPNPALTGTVNGEDGCQGWRCDCSLDPTDKRRSPEAYGKLEAILGMR